MTTIVHDTLSNFINESLLLEKRSHPETNVKESFNSIIKKILNISPNLENVYVSFRNSLHVTDINPSNQFNTPSGFYCYPVKQYVDDMEEPYENLETNGELWFRRLFPFASNRRYLIFYIMDERANIISNSSPFKDTVTYVERIKDIFNSYSEILSVCDLYIKGEYGIRYEQNKHEQPLSAAQMLWEFIFDVCNMYDDIATRIVEIPSLYTKIAYKIGLDGFIDDAGDGYIHPNEKTQAVFFRVKNKGEIFTFDTKVNIKETDDDTVQSYPTKNPNVRLIIKTNKSLMLNKSYNLALNGRILYKEWLKKIDIFMSPMRGFSDVMILERKDGTKNLLNINDVNNLYLSEWFDNVKILSKRYKGVVSLFSVNNNNDLFHIIDVNGAELNYGNIVGIDFSILRNVCLDMDNGFYKIINNDGEIVANDVKSYKIHPSKSPLIIINDAKLGSNILDASKSTLLLEWQPNRLVWTNNGNNVRFSNRSGGEIIEFDVTNYIKNEML